MGIIDYIAKEKSFRNDSHHHIIPVSYTHLDVYKRQALTLPKFPQFVMFIFASATHPTIPPVLQDTPPVPLLLSISALLMQLLIVVGLVAPATPPTIPPTRSLPSIRPYSIVIFLIVAAVTAPNKPVWKELSPLFIYKLRILWPCPSNSPLKVQLPARLLPS